MSQTALTIVGSMGVIAAAFAAFFWFWASVIEVPDNIDTFIAALHQVSRVNAWGGTSGGVLNFAGPLKKFLRRDKRNAS
jgi:hypothetical protein